MSATEHWLHNGMINLSMSITFVNFHGPPVRIARFRSIIPSSANDVALVSATQILRFLILPADSSNQTSSSRWNDASSLNISIYRDNLIQHVLFGLVADWSELKSALKTTSFSKGRSINDYARHTGKSEVSWVSKRECQVEVVAYHHRRVAGQDSWSSDG